MYSAASRKPPDAGGRPGTLALVIDLEAMERNLRRAAEYTAQQSLHFRPHPKTHRTPAIGKRQLELGATGLTIAKVGESRIDVSRSAWPRSHARCAVALDSVEAANQPSQVAVVSGVRFAALTEVDVGLGRVGVTPGEGPLRFAGRVGG